MSYRLLNPLVRTQHFRLLESRRREFRLLEGFVDTVKGLVKSDWSLDAYTKDMFKGGEAKSGLGKTLGWTKDTRFIDRLQDTVSLVGIADPTGIADAANALTYAARGKWADAGVAALGIIPYLGDLAKGSKFLKGGAKAEKVIGKVAAKSAERTAAKGALHGAELVAEKATMRAAEQGAAKATGKAAAHGAETAATKGGFVSRAKQVYQKGREVYDKAKPYIERGKEAQEKVQARRDAEAQRSGNSPQANILTKARGAADTATGAAAQASGAVGQGRGAFGQAKGAFQAAKGGNLRSAFDSAKGAFTSAKGAHAQGKQVYDTTADLGRRAKGALSREAPPLSMAPPDPGPMAREREATQRPPAARAAPQKGGGAGASKGSGGATYVPVDDDCPGKKTKTTTWKAPTGMKRCAGQTPGRDHGD